MSSISFNYGPGYIPSYVATPLVTVTYSSYITVNVYPLFYKKNIIEWSIPAQMGDCTFNVYKSPTDVGPWEKVNPVPLRNTNFVEDINTQDYSKFRKSWYTVEVHLPFPDLRYIISSPTSWENKRNSLMEIRAQEITRRETILLNKFTGVDSLIFRRMYFGQRCPNCYDKEVEKVMQDHCTVCLGTSFTGGYYPGIPTKICYEISPNQTQLTYVGKMETNNTSCWTINTPEVDTLDLILRISDSKLFRVEGVNQTELQAVQVRQIMSITELAKSSVEFDLLISNNVISTQYTMPGLNPVNSNSNVGYII
jgi:hypothetical protein